MKMGTIYELGGIQKRSGKEENVWGNKKWLKGCPNRFNPNNNKKYNIKLKMIISIHSIKRIRMNNLIGTQ
jgi:hypothetical protein